MIFLIREIKITPININFNSKNIFNFQGNPLWFWGYVVVFDRHEQGVFGVRRNKLHVFLVKEKMNSFKEEILGVENWPLSFEEIERVIKHRVPGLKMRFLYEATHNFKGLFKGGVNCCFCLCELTTTQTNMHHWVCFGHSKTKKNKKGHKRQKIHQSEKL